MLVNNIHSIPLPLTPRPARKPRPAVDARLNIPFTITELNIDLQNLPTLSTRVHYRIPYSELRHLGNNSRKHVLVFFNKCWNCDIVPDQWKVTTLIPLLKRRKSSNALFLFRLITLTCCVRNVTEEVMKGHLIWYV